MTQSLLSHYHAELDYLRNAGAAFAKEHPKTAGMLRFDQHGSDDPLVARLVESFAFLTAKIAAQTEADETLLARNLIQILYPMALLPIPSMTTIQCVPHKSLDRVVTIPKHTALETTSKMDDLCYFRTGYAVDVMPLEMRCSPLKPIAECPHYLKAPHNAKAYLTLSFKSLNKAFLHHQYPNKPMRWFLNAYKQSANSLYAYLMQHQIGIQAVARKDEQLTVSRLHDKPLQPVGFSSDDLLWPSKNSDFDYCQIFSEYAAFPEKHMYIDVPCFKACIDECDAINIECTLFLDVWSPDLERLFRDDLFQLGCAPVVNIFESKSKPIALHHQHTHYPVQADNQLKRQHCEILMVSDIHCWQNQGKTVSCQEMYHTSFSKAADTPTIYWQTEQKPSWALGSDVLLGHETFMQMNAQALGNDSAHIVADLLCMNRDTASKANLCQQGGEFKIQAENSTTYQINCLHHATPTRREQLPEKMHDLVALLVKGHDQLFTPSQEPIDPTVLKTKLHALNRSQEDDITLLINRIVSLRCARVSRRYPHSTQLTYVQGLKVQLHMESLQIEQNDHYLFASVLNAWLKYYCPVNSFIELCLVDMANGRSQTWPPYFQ